MASVSLENGEKYDCIGISKADIIQKMEMIFGQKVVGIRPKKTKFIVPSMKFAAHKVQKKD